MVVLHIVINRWQPYALLLLSPTNKCILFVAYTKECLKIRFSLVGVSLCALFDMYQHFGATCLVPTCQITWPHTPDAVGMCGVLD